MISELQVVFWLPGVLFKFLDEVEMLELTIPDTEMWDEEHRKFVTQRGATIHLEHSLISVSKWESIHQKAFLGREDKTVDETIDYVRCMTLDKNIPKEVYQCVTDDNIKAVNEYIANPYSATKFFDSRMHKTTAMPKDTMTSEVIYYLMFAYSIPKECEKWHLNRLLTLLRVFDIKSNPQKKMSRRDIANQNRRLNEERRRKLHTKG